MNPTDPAVWLTLIGLGAFHGLNPAMGWLLAVAMGLQEERGRAVARALGPLAMGHALAVGAAVGLAAGLGLVISVEVVRYAVAAGLLGMGFYKLFRQRHPAYGSLRMGGRQLTFWSFLMASAHGAGLMVVPFVLPGRSVATPDLLHDPIAHDPWLAVQATAVHTVAYLGVTGLVAGVVYWKFGLGFLRRGWVNIDLVWAAALLATGVFTLLW